MDPSALYRSIVETSPDGIWVIDLDGRTLYANPRLAGMFGVAPDDVGRLTVFDSLDEVGKAQFAQHLRRVRAGELNDRDVEAQFVRQDGSTMWVLVRESGLYDDAGGLVALLHRLTDYSDRRRMVAELQESERRLEDSQRIARVGSWEWDHGHNRISGSTGLGLLYGLEPAEFPESYEDFLDMVHPDDRSIVEEAVAVALAGTNEFVFVARMRAREERWVWTRARGVVRRDEQGAVLGMSGTHQDITEVKEAELALIDLVSQNILMQAVASAANEAGSLREVLLQARELVVVHDDWRRARAFLPSESGTGLVPLDAGPEIAAEDLATPDETGTELELAHESLRRRQRVWSEDRLTIAFPVGFDDVISAVVTITSAPPLFRHQMIEDMVEAVAVQLGRVAEREHTERALAEARDAAMEASRQKSEFLATMSHEIRTPLNGVIGLNDLLLRDGLTPEQRRLASGVQAASRALLSVINDVLDFSKIEAGRMDLETVDFEVRDLVEQVASLLGPAAREKGVDLEVRLDGAVPDVLAGDPTRLSQVLNNLVSNAVKFSDEGSVLVRVTAPASDQGHVDLRFEVIDDGIGIDPAHVSGMFAPFTQADTSTTRLYGGTGLGLAISRQIVDALGGDLAYEPNPTGGSIFVVTVKLARPTGRGRDARTSPEPAPAARVATQGARVLVVEDNEVNQLVARGLLEALGVQVDVADDGVAGLRALEDGRFDAVLMDVQMPRMDGYEATRTIRQRETSGHRIPIIAMTAAAVEGERERCLAAGMDDYLTKPVDPRALEATIRQWLATATPLDHTAEVTALPPSPAIEGLDTERLDMLRDLDPGDTSYLDRAIGNFQVNSVSAVEALRERIAADDIDGMKAAAHKLAGSALNLGAPRAGEAAREIELLGDSGTTDGALDLLFELEAACERARELLLRYQASYQDQGEPTAPSDRSGPARTQEET